MEERGGSLDWQTYKMDRAREHGYPGEGAGAVKVEGFAHEETKPMAPGDAAIRNGNADDDADVVDDEEDEEDVDDEDDEDDDDVDDELEEEDEEEDVEGELQDLPSVSSDSDGFLSGYEESDQEDQDMLEEGDGGVTGGTSTGAATASRPNYATACNWEECPAPRYETTEQLVQHVTREHIGNRKPEYVCHWNGCRRKGELLANRRKLVTHMQTHTGEKRYHCSETGCQRTFSRYDGIVKHKRDVHGIGKLMPPQGSWEVDVVDRAGEDVEPDSMIHDDGRYLGLELDEKLLQMYCQEDDAAEREESGMSLGDLEKHYATLKRTYHLALQERQELSKQVDDTTYRYRVAAKKKEYVLERVLRDAICCENAGGEAAAVAVLR